MITEIDIMRDGPHGLVGGTTRSGKTEFLKSLITSLAVSNHPDDLSIVIVDFKGGVDHELSAMLPHVIDLSTNHNVDSFVRTVRLIEAEQQRRQHEFKGVGAPNFDAYRAARRANPSLRPIPRLMVIIDEFSELLSSETGKANLSALESVTRVGGGLGVHLLLVTQNFENQLPSQIAANAGLRICFRVQEDAHSKAVLNSPESASIPKERIGRAFWRSHGGRVIEFQAARVAGPRPGKETANAAVQARIVPFSTVADSPPEPPIVDVPAEDTDMYAIVDVIKKAAAHSGWNAPAVPWPKDLPLDLSLGDLRDAEEVWPVGLLDEPERQQQTPIGLEAYGPHTFFVGGAAARMGEVLRAVVVGGVARRSPEELHLYVIDELGQGLSALQALPHVGGVAERNEPLALRILRHVIAEVGRREGPLHRSGGGQRAGTALLRRREAARRRARRARRRPPPYARRSSAKSPLGAAVGAIAGVGRHRGPGPAERTVVVGSSPHRLVHRPIASSWNAPTLRSTRPSEYLGPYSGLWTAWAGRWTCRASI